jgi:hypothetical protein
MSALLGFAEMALDCYEDPGSSPLQGWRRIETTQNKNFFAAAYRQDRTNSVAVAYRGTVIGSKRDYAADLGGIGFSLNALLLEIQSAVDFAYKYSQRTNDVWLVGHSLGGAYVQLVAAILNMWGITFNAPGVLNLVNQISTHRATKIVGTFCSPAMQVVLRTFAPVDVVSFFNKAAAADDDLAFVPVSNYRAQNDPVSLTGTHVGAPLKVIPVHSTSPLDAHRMVHIVEALGGRVRPVKETAEKESAVAA